MIWKSSIYKFVIPTKNQKYKEVFIDVTRSAPPMKQTGKELQETFDWALSAVKKNPRVLDFGAGRLRNIPYLLKQGCSVAAVEFEKLMSSDLAKRNITTASTYGSKYQRITFPHQFFKSDLKFDLIIFINVLSVMPVAAERSLVLKYCREKLTEKGLMLWYSQTTQSFYSDKFDDDHKLGDGYVPNDSDRYKSFYKDFEAKEVDELFLSSGLRFHDRRTVPHVIARLYRPVGENPLDPILDAKIIRKYVKGDMEFEKPKKVIPVLLTKKDKPKPNIPDPEELSVPRLYEEAIKKSSKRNIACKHVSKHRWSRFFFPLWETLERY